MPFQMPMTLGAAFRVYPMRHGKTDPQLADQRPGRPKSIKVGRTRPANAYRYYGQMSFIEGRVVVVFVANNKRRQLLGLEYEAVARQETVGA